MNLKVSSSKEVKALPEFFNDFFQDLKACYPSWRNQLLTVPEEKKFKQQWLKAFSENGVNTPEKIKCGLVAARKDKSSWLPSSGQFIEWCKPTAESLGLPDVRAAYREAVFHRADDEWSCALVFYAQRGIHYELRNLPESKSFRLFEQMYQGVLQKVIDGAVLAEPPKPLPAPEEVACKGDPDAISDLIGGIFADMGWSREHG